MTLGKCRLEVKAASGDDGMAALHDSFPDWDP